MNKKSSLVIILILVSSIFYAQKIEYLKDSIEYKKELFDLTFKNRVSKCYVTIFNSSFSLIRFKNNPEIVKRFNRHFEPNVLKQIYGINHFLYPYTDWGAIYFNRYNDSVIFVRDMAIDDFIFIQDSLRNIKDNNAKPKFKYYSLQALEPFIFSITKKNQTKIYAVLSFYDRIKVFDIYGGVGKIDLYERKNNKWEKIEELLNWY